MHYLISDLSAEKLGDIKLLPGTTSNYTDLGIQHHLPSRQPKHATYEGRLRTFEGWPINLRQTPEMLADAGFYYVGKFRKKFVILKNFILQILNMDVI